MACLLIGTSGAKDAPPSLKQVWSYAAGSQPVEASAVLRNVSGVDLRTEQLAQGVLDLARPPIGEGDWNRIEPVLARLAAGNDQIAARALYLRARMYQVHRTPPDYGQAEALYRELARRWPGSHWAQLGLVKLGMLKLFGLPEPADPRQRLAAVEALLAGIKEPFLRRDLELQIGWAGVFYDLPYDEVVPHLIAADRVGGILGITPEELVIQIGELSFRAGQLEQAKAYFERFLRDFPTNTRRYNVQQRLRQVEEAMGRKEGAA